MNIIVLGAGAFGTAIANELSVNRANKVLLYSRNQKKVAVSYTHLTLPTKA